MVEAQARRRTAVAVGMAVVVLVGAGCSGPATGDPATPDQSSPGSVTTSPAVSSGAGSSATGGSSASATPTADPRPTAGSARGPARNLPKPTMPAAAKQETEAGLLAYAKYWVDALSYAYKTNDMSLARGISSKTCVDCIKFYEAFNRSIPTQGWGSGGAISATFQLRDGFVPDANGQYIVLATLTQQAYSIYSRGGALVAQNSKSDQFVLLLAVARVNEQWVLENYDQIAQ